MATDERFDLALEHTYADALGELCLPWQGAPVPEPRVELLNEPLAATLGLDPEVLGGPRGAAWFCGLDLPSSARPVAQAYAGHQFGGYSPRLGDGRALLVGELIDPTGRRRDLHLKGSGRTPFSRGGDGKAAIGPMVREYVIGESMHALGIPTTRALAVVSTGEQVIRERPLPGAVLARVAASHLRVGTFQFAAAAARTTVTRPATVEPGGDSPVRASGAAGASPSLLARLADYAIARHYPALAAFDAGAERYRALLDAVVEVQASLIARWINVGFIHGVMNTDNMTISGETIDYGPCAFMDAFNPATVFSSIDHQGRYAFGNQPNIGLWNLSRFAETLLPLLDDDADTAVGLATATLETYSARFRHHWLDELHRRLGLDAGNPLTARAVGDLTLVNGLQVALDRHRADLIGTMRALGAVLRGDAGRFDGHFARGTDDDPSVDARADVVAWREQWTAAALGGHAVGSDAAHLLADRLDGLNPCYVPRNHRVEEALAAATIGDFAPTAALVEALSNPFEERPQWARYAEPAPREYEEGYATFCGT